MLLSRCVSAHAATGVDLTSTVFETGGSLYLYGRLKSNAGCSAPTDFCTDVTQQVTMYVTLTDGPGQLSTVPIVGPPTRASLPGQHSGGLPQLNSSSPHPGPAQQLPSQPHALPPQVGVQPLATECNGTE